MPDLFLDLARGLERACFDYLIIEDSSMVPYTYQGSHDTYLRYAASTPKLDPAVLVPYLAQATTHLGLVPTLSVTEYPPFLLARLVNSLDHVTEGRVGWNCVTSSNDGAAQNYGHAEQPPHDERYDLADEFADLVTKLWDAWEPDAVVLDRETPMFADGSKVHAVNHVGQVFPLPRPAECAALAARPRRRSARPAAPPRGQDFAARWADTIITEAGSVDAMKDYREGVRRRARAAGRDPDYDQGAVSGLSAGRHDDGGGAGAAAPEARRRQPASRSGAIQHVAPDQYRFLAVRPRMSRYRSCPPTATSHRWPNGSARRRGKSPSAKPPRPASISPARSTTSPA